MSAVRLGPQQKCRWSLWTDQKSLPCWRDSGQFPLAGEQGENSLSDWLGLDAVDDGVEHKRHKEIDDRQERGDQGQSMLDSTMYHRHANHGHIVHEHRTDMWHTCVEGLLLSLPGSNVQHHVKNQHIRDHDEQWVQPKPGQGNGQTQDAISTQQLDQVWVEAVGMGENISVTVRQSPQNDWQWTHEHHTLQRDAQTHADDIRQD